MELFFDQSEDEVNPEEVSQGPVTGLGDNVAAGFQSYRAGDSLFSEEFMMDEARAERRAAIENATGKPYDEALAPYREKIPIKWERARDRADGAGPVINYEDQAVELLASDVPERYEAGGIFVGARLAARAREIAEERRAQSADVANRASGSFTKIAGQFAGAAGGALTDPLILGTLPFGAAGGSSILTAMAIEAALAGGVTAGSMPWVQEWQRAIGEDPTFSDAAIDTLVSAGAAAVTVGAIRGAGKLVELSGSKAELLRRYREAVIDPTPDQAAAAKALEVEVEMARASPFDDTPEGDAQHLARAAEAEAALENGESLVTPEDGFLFGRPTDRIPPPAQRADGLDLDQSRVAAAEPGAVDDLAPSDLLAVTKHADTLEADVLRGLEDGGDFQVPFFDRGADGGVDARSARSVLDEIAKDKEHIEQLEVCLK